MQRERQDRQRVWEIPSHVEREGVCVYSGWSGEV